MSVAAVKSQVKFLPFHQASIDESEIAGVIDVLRSGWLTTGPRTREFESSFASYVGARHGVALNSCTAALHLALAAIGLRADDEVILPTMTFAASGEVVLYFSARPVLIDCAPNSFHLDPAKIEALITPRTRAILPVHYAGCPCDMDAIFEIARRRNLKIIEDAAHALPSRYRSHSIGTLGDITCFSFYATKTLTTGEGGMATTNNDDYAHRMSILSLHGISRDAWRRYSAEGSWRYDILEAGFKYNLTDLSAAIGLAQLAKCDAMHARRTAIAALYTESLRSSALGEVFETPPLPAEVLTNIQHSWHLYVILLRPSALRIGRDALIEELKHRGIGTSVHFIPLHLHPLYQKHLGYRAGDFPEAEDRFARCISLPIYPSMSDDDVARVVEALADIAQLHKR